MLQTTFFSSWSGYIKPITQLLIMYSQNPSSYEKFSTSQPPAFSQDTTTTGIPVTSTSQFYSTDDSRSSIELRSKNKGPWSTGLCDCHDDWRNCKLKKLLLLVARFSHAIYLWAWGWDSWYLIVWVNGCFFLSLSLSLSLFIFVVLQAA
jgi:hypothetical protein